METIMNIDKIAEELSAKIYNQAVHAFRSSYDHEEATHWIKSALQSVMPKWLPIDERAKSGEMFLLLMEPEPVNTTNVCIGYFDQRVECWYVQYGCGERVLPVSYMQLPSEPEVKK
jgi:hypothetical protein